MDREAAHAENTRRRNGVLQELRLMAIMGVVYLAWTVFVLCALSWLINGPGAAVGGWLNRTLPTVPPTIQESPWIVVALGVVVAAIFVGLLGYRIVRDVRIHRRIRHEDSGLYAEFTAEIHAIEVRHPQLAIPLAGVERTVRARRESVWTDIGRFLAFWVKRA